MGLIYNLLHWVDHVVETPHKRKFIDNGDGTVTEQKVTGEVIRQGTARNATNYNNLETGVLACSVYDAVLQQQILQHQRTIGDLSGEASEIVLNNTIPYPFNSSPTTVSLKQKRSSLTYSVKCEILETTGGFIDSIEVFDKQLNGFKMRFKGSAKSAKLRYSVSGGMYQ